MNNLHLSQILWEITNICDRNCSYCGSKDIIKPYNGNNLSEIKYKHIDKIVSELLAYPPEQLTLTGGEPGILDSPYILSIVTSLSQKMKVKVISNGKVFEWRDSILKMLSVIGLSCNDKGDIKRLSEEYDACQCTGHDLFLDKTTLISNFGTHNIWDFDAIHEFFTINKYSTLIKMPVWQVQLTMGENQLPASGIKHLIKQIKSLKYAEIIPFAVYENEFKQQIILADNLQKDHDCNAGINSCSITYDGYVVPCLSMRSWDKDFGLASYKLEDTRTLKGIWETGFTNRRFSCAKCCRDCIDYGDAFKEEAKPKLDRDYIVSKDLLKEPCKPNLYRPDVYVYAPTEPFTPDPFFKKYYTTCSSDTIVTDKSNTTDSITDPRD